MTCSRVSFKEENKLSFLILSHRNNSPLFCSHPNMHTWLLGLVNADFVRQLHVWKNTDGSNCIVHAIVSHLVEKNEKCCGPPIFCKSCTHLIPESPVNHSFYARPVNHSLTSLALLFVTEENPNWRLLKTCNLLLSLSLCNLQMFKDAHLFMPAPLASRQFEHFLLSAQSVKT